MWLPLGAIAETWAEMKEMTDAGEFDRPNWWRTAWVPFLKTVVGTFEKTTWPADESLWETNEDLYPAGFPKRFDA
jgi:hypothetical protein